MKIYTTILFCVLVGHLASGQYYIKNSGIKTSVSARNQLQHNETRLSENNYPDTYGGGYKPAQVYMGGEYNQFEEMQNFVVKTTPPTPLDPIADFINKTRSKMATGVCYTEVPTSSLVHSSNAAVVGNGTTPNMSRVQICCAGYQRNPHVFQRCEPICKNDCPNGICAAPDTCVCLPGHLQDHEGNCVATCPVGCANGFCAENGECRCKPGYKLEPLNRKFCVPHCELSCGQGRCIGPNTCACAEGYRPNVLGTCEPVCESCENGACTAPGVCECHNGYKRVQNSCEPVCSLGCDKGRCVKPETCECSDGLNLDTSGSKCVPYCARPCVNGDCAGSNKCTCHLGYAQDDSDWTICKPVCSHGCPQGYCSAPELCRCNPGFTKSGIKGRTFCVPA